MFCPNCGTKVSSDQKYCPACGSMITHDAPVPSSVPPVAPMTLNTTKPSFFDVFKKYLPYILIAILLIAGIVLAVIFLGGKSKKKDGEKSSTSTPESVAEAFMTANFEGDMKKQYNYYVISAEKSAEYYADKMGFSSVEEYLEDMGYDSVDELLEEEGEKQREDYEDDFGKGYTCSAEADEVTDLEGKDFDEVIERLEKYEDYIDLDSIEEACEVSGTVTFTCNEEVVEERDGSVILVKIDGKWKVAY